MSRHCKFNIISGKRPGTYCSIKGFHVLTDMPAAFQKLLCHPIPDSIHDADLQNLHLTHPWSWRMTSLGQYDFWSYMEREIFKKSQIAKPLQKLTRTLNQLSRHIIENLTRIDLNLMSISDYIKRII